MTWQRDVAEMAMRGDHEGVLRRLEREGLTRPTQTTWMLVERLYDYEPSSNFKVDAGEHDMDRLEEAIDDTCDWCVMHKGGEYESFEELSLRDIVGTRPDSKWVWLGDEYRKRCEDALNSRREGVGYPGLWATDTLISRYMFELRQFELVFGCTPEGHDSTFGVAEGPPTMADTFKMDARAAFAKFNWSLLDDGSSVTGITNAINDPNTYAGIKDDD